MVFSRDSKSELHMYEPFVRAFNYALDEISKINVAGLPKYSEEKQIVFVSHHDRVVHSAHHQRDSRARPDIVILQWNAFKEKMQLPTSPYSDTYDGDICVSKSELSLVWRDVRSTVEMKITGLPKREQWSRNFDVGFKSLSGPAYISVGDADQPEITHESLPYAQCKCALFGGFPLPIFLDRWHPELKEIGRKETAHHGRKRCNHDVV
jgi:hypothetical protein